MRALLERSPASRRALRRPLPAGNLRLVLLAVALLGALVLLISEFTTLYQVHEQATSRVVKTQSGGPNHDYALALVAVLTAFLGAGVWQAGSRPALLAIGVLGLLALAVALLVDLPSARATGLLALPEGHGLANGAAKPSGGFFLETLGALLLLATCVCGFLLVGPEHPRPDGPGPGAAPGPPLGPDPAP